MMLSLLVKVDRLLTVQTDLALVPFFQGEPPCHGWAGEFDWYFCGFLSTLLRKGRVAGRPGQKVLLKDMGKLNARYVLLFGFGPRFSLDPVQLKRLYREFVLALRDLEVERVAIGSLRDEVSLAYGTSPLRHAVQGLLDGYAAEMEKVRRALSVTILESDVRRRAEVKREVEAAVSDFEKPVEAHVLA